MLLSSGLGLGLAKNGLGYITARLSLRHLMVQYRLNIILSYVLLLAPTSVKMVAVSLLLKFPRYVSRDVTTILPGRLCRSNYGLSFWCWSRGLIVDFAAAKNGLAYITAGDDGERMRRVKVVALSLSSVKVGLIQVRDSAGVSLRRLCHLLTARRCRKQQVRP